MSEIPNICKKCGKLFLGNKCECGWEVLPETPKPVEKIEKGKRKLEGVFR